MGQWRGELRKSLHWDRGTGLRELILTGPATLILVLGTRAFVVSEECCGGESWVSQGRRVCACGAKLAFMSLGRGGRDAVVRAGLTEAHLSQLVRMMEECEAYLKVRGRVEPWVEDGPAIRRMVAAHLPWVTMTEEMAIGAFATRSCL